MNLYSVVALLLITSSAVSATEGAPIADIETEYVVSSPTPTKFKPAEQDINEAIAAFDTFQNLRDRGKLNEAYAMLTDSNQQLMPWQKWEKIQKSWQQDYGTDLSRQIFRISWYPNPPSADQTGIYIALDFAARTQKDGFRCGYIVLVKQPATPLKVARTEDTHIPEELIDGKLPRADVLDKLPCYIGKNIKTAFPSTGK
jgi:hypothetical protein